MQDIQGKDLIAGAMYACVFVDEDGDGQAVASYGELVRFVRYETNTFADNTTSVRAVFADADTWDEVQAEFEELQLQDAPIIDPATKGWPAIDA
ncbi:hypothetical protein SB783_37415 [Paraburkholderia sp. SIMBA_009]